MIIIKIHFIKYGADFISYFPDSKRFFKTNKKGMYLMKSIVEGVDNDKLCSDFKITADELKKYKQNISEYILPIAPKMGQNVEICSKNKKVLDRLVIHVSNACNLRCKYCYANGGVYHSDESILTREMADNILNVFYKQFDKINIIQLFGGEPLMNMKMIEYICAKVRKHDMENECKTLIGIVTNGTLIDDKFIEIVKKYDMGVTISYDGNRIVNDILRPYPNGSGSSEKVLKNIRKLKAATQQPSTIEVTYTQQHIDNNVSIIDIVKDVYNEIPNTSIHLVPAGGNDQCSFALKDLSVFPESIDELFSANSKESEKSYTYSLAQRIINGIVNKPVGSLFICDAGLGTISVSVKGDVYPCFMFTDTDDLVLGNISDENLFESDIYKSLIEKITNFSYKKNNDECKNCFINTLCNGCLGLNYMQSGDIYSLSKVSCDMYKEMTEKVLIQLAKAIDSKKECANV